MGYTSNVLRKLVVSASKMKTDDPFAETATTSFKGRISSGGKCSTLRNLEPCVYEMYGNTQSKQFYLLTSYFFSYVIQCTLVR